MTFWPFQSHSGEHEKFNMATFKKRSAAERKTCGQSQFGQNIVEGDRLGFPCLCRVTCLLLIRRSLK